MILEIHGAGFKNKGAELMLRTVTSELSARLPQFVPAIDPAYGRYEQRATLGLRQILPRRTHVGSLRFSWHFRHQRLVSALPGNFAFRLLSGAETADYGCVTLSKIQGFIDIAGFAYTSLWGNKPTQDLAQLISYFRKRQIPIILLPQAFGPFETPEIRAAMQEVLQSASLIYARDAESFAYLQELSPTSKNINQAPDITLFYPRKKLQNTKKRSRIVGIVPNARMLDQGKELWGSNYYEILVAIISSLIRHEISVEILVHDASGQDEKVAKEIQNRIDTAQLPIYTASDPLIVKKRIGEYRLIIGSRYHSLVAALSTMVPAIALGWAHKYQLLMEEFNLGEYLLQPDTPAQEAAGMVEHLLQEDVNEHYRTQISRKLKQLYMTNQEMWDRVIDVLKFVN
jgi:colanic acid/amylovoran biosynthesis protein